MMSLDALARSVMLGCRSQKHEEALEAFGVEAPDPETALLLRAVVVGTAQLAGQTPLEMTPDLAPCDPTDECPLSAAAVPLFRQAMEGQFSAVFPEFLALMAHQRLHAPPETLPTLLGMVRQGEHAEAVLRVIGPRGRWLAGHNPAWAFAADQDPLEAWESGDFDVRLAALKKLREADPAEARSRLEAGWEDESPADKAGFLAALRIGLSMADEAFLVQAIKDSRQEVRRAAGAVLLQLEDSRFVGAMWTTARQCIDLDSPSFKKPILRITLSDKLDSAVKWHGISKEIKHKKMGVDAARLAQVLAFVPPKFWCLDFKKKPEDLIALALDTDWAMALLRGWYAAAVALRDLDWITAFAGERLRITGKLQANFSYQEMQALFGLLPIQTVESLATETVLLAKRDLNNAHPLLQMLPSVEGLWTVKLARIVIRSAQKQSKARPGLICGQLPEYACHVPTELAREIELAWPKDHHVGWTADIDAFTRILQFRKQIRQVLAEQ